MATTPIPMPQQQTQGDPGLNPTDPRAILAALAQGHTTGQGTTSVGSQIPMPQPIGRPMQPAQQSGVPQGSFATKGAHQRASLQSLTGSVQNLVSTAVNIHEQQQNKQLGQKFSTLTGSVKGIQTADEMTKNAQSILQNDPNSTQGQQMLQAAQQMKQHNTTILNQLLDPNTPEGKKNTKLFNKGFGFDDKNADTPERAAAIQAMRSQSQNQTQSTTPAITAPGSMGSTQQLTQPQQGPNVSQQGSGLNEGASRLLSQMPTGLQLSPQTQAQAEMVKAGVTPKAATGGQILQSQGGASKTLVQDQQKAAELNLKTERLGLDATGNPLPIDKLPLEKQAKVTDERAKDTLDGAQTQLAQAKAKALADPNSIPNKIALMRAQGYAGIASAMALRAKVGLLNYEMNAYGTGQQGEVLPGSVTINGQTVGKALAPAATKAIQTQAQFIDAAGSIDNLSAAALEMQQSGQALNDPRLVKLLNDPRMKVGDSEWFHNQMSSEIGSSLTSQQRDYLIAQRQARENLMAIRKILGTGVSVKSMDAITNTLPGAQTPDYAYADKQLQAVKGQLQRLQQGVPQINVQSRPNQPGAQPQAPAAKAGDPLGIF